MLKTHQVALSIHADLPMCEDKAAGHDFFGPDNDAHNGSRLHGPEALEAEGVHYGQVAVDGDAAQETHADVDVLIQDDATNLAQQLVVGPVVML